MYFSQRKQPLALSSFQNSTSLGQIYFIQCFLNKVCLEWPQPLISRAAAQRFEVSFLPDREIALTICQVFFFHVSLLLPYLSCSSCCQEKASIQKDKHRKKKVVQMKKVSRDGYRGMIHKNWYLKRKKEEKKN